MWVPLLLLCTGALLLGAPAGSSADVSVNSLGRNRREGEGRRCGSRGWCRLNLQAQGNTHSWHNAERTLPSVAGGGQLLPPPWPLLQVQLFKPAQVLGRSKLGGGPER